MNQPNYIMLMAHIADVPDPRNAVLTLLRYEGWTNIPDAFRHFAASVQHSLQTIGALET